MCHVSCVTGQLSALTCHLSPVTCQEEKNYVEEKKINKKLDKVVKLVGGGSVINGAAKQS